MAPKQTDPQYKLRLTADLKQAIEHAAAKNSRSMNSEILARLEDSFRPQSAATSLDLIANDLLKRMVAAPKSAPAQMMDRFSDLFEELRKQETRGKLRLLSMANEIIEEMGAIAPPADEEAEFSGETSIDQR